MSYLSPQAGEIVANNLRQPTDMTRDSWTSMSNTYGSASSPQASQGNPWPLRQPPRLRQGGKA